MGYWLLAWLCGSAAIRAFTPYTLHPTLYTLHPTPYTLHSTPYTLRSTLYALLSGFIVGNSSTSWMDG